MGATGSIAVVQDGVRSPRENQLLSALRDASFPAASEVPRLNGHPGASKHDAKVGSTTVCKMLRRSVAPGASRASQKRDYGPRAATNGFGHCVSLGALKSGPPKLSAQPDAGKLGILDLSLAMAAPMPHVRIQAGAGGSSDRVLSNIADSLGLYKLVEGLVVHGRSVWRHSSAADRWLSFSPAGWLVVTERTLERLQREANEWTPKLNEAAVGCFLLLEDTQGQSPYHRPSGVAWMAW